MLDDSPEILSVFVITPSDKVTRRDEIDRAVKISYARAYQAKEMCSRVGQCALVVSHEEFYGDDSPNNVDKYSLSCDDDCPLLIGKETKDSEMDT